MGAIDFLLPKGPPEELQRIQDDLRSRFTYEDYTKRDFFRAVPAKGPFSGNCAIYATAARNALALNGVKYGTPEVLPYIMPDGRGHAVTRIGDWVFDNRNKWVTHVKDHEAIREKGE